MKPLTQVTLYWFVAVIISVIIDYAIGAYRLANQPSLGDAALVLFGGALTLLVLAGLPVIVIAWAVVAWRGLTRSSGGRASHPRQRGYTPGPEATRPPDAGYRWLA